MAVKLYGPEEIALGVTEVGPGHERTDIQVAGIFSAFGRFSVAGGETSLTRFSRFPPGDVTLMPYVKLTASGSLQSMLTVCKYVYIIN